MTALAAVTRVLDEAIEAVKWPVAVLAVLLLPASALAFASLAATLIDGGGAARTVLHGPAAGIALLLGAAAYLAAWAFHLRRRPATAFLMALEHEVSHGLVAAATFHPIQALRVSGRDGSWVDYVGGTNWLIATAPYFLPMASALTLAALTLVALPAGGDPLTGAVVLGAVLAYQGTAAWTQLHRRQLDLHQVGFLFAWAFLPTANLLGYGLLLAVAGHGAEGPAVLGAHVWRAAVALGGWAG